MFVSMINAGRQYSVNLEKKTGLNAFSKCKIVSCSIRSTN